MVEMQQFLIISYLVTNTKYGIDYNTKKTQNEQKNPCNT